MASFIQNVKRSLALGGIWAIAFYLISGTIVLVGLSVTVHNRPTINSSGFADSSLLGLYNQLLPLLSSAFLGYLSMRLARQLLIRVLNAYILGLGTQAVYQTFPNNLWLYWKTYPTAWWIFLMIAFWVLMDYLQLNNHKKSAIQLLRIPVLLGMFWVDWMATTGFIVIYNVLYLRGQTVPSKFIVFLQFMKLPVGVGLAIFAVMYIYSYVDFNQFIEVPAKFSLYAFWDSGIMSWGHNLQLVNLPSWKILWVLGIASMIAIIVFVEWKKKYFPQQAILISGVMAYPFAVFIFPETFLIQEVYGIYLAPSFFLALFTLLPAWLETLNKHSGIFILVSILLAFCTACVQLRNYAIHFPMYPS